MFSKKGSIILVITILAMATLACSALSGGASKIQAKCASKYEAKPTQPKAPLNTSRES